MTCTAQQQVERGCEKPVKGQNVLVIDGVEQRRCPRRPILEQPVYYAELFWRYRQFKQGFLTEPGGLSDQPDKLMECFKVMDHSCNRVEVFKEEQAEVKRRRGARAAAKGQRPQRRR